MKFYITDQTRVEIENRIRSINKNMHDMAMITFGIDIDKSVGEENRKEIEMLEKILSNSVPLIPVIENAYTKGFGEGTCFGATTIYKYETSKDYISNLKLDI